LRLKLAVAFAFSEDLNSSQPDECIAKTEKVAWRQIPVNLHDVSVEASPYVAMNS
jgi:hypothetical protein